MEYVKLGTTGLDVVKAGTARHLGASSMHAWQFASAQFAAERHGWTRFATTQDHDNLLYREEEREMIPFCRATGVALIPWSPMARGRLTREPDATTARSETDLFGRTLGAEGDRRIIDAVGKVAAERGVPRAQVALAWVSQQPGVAAPIIGATKPQHLEDALASLAVVLTQEELTALEEPYLPRAVAGHG